MVYLDTLKKRHETLIALDETKVKPGRLESHRREIERLSRQIQTMTPPTVTVYAKIDERKTDTQKQWQAKGRKRAAKKKAARKIRKGAHS